MRVNGTQCTGSPNRTLPQVKHFMNIYVCKTKLLLVLVPSLLLHFDNVLLIKATYPYSVTLNLKMGMLP